MTQTQMNNIMILHVHKQLTDQLNILEIGNDYIRESSHREALFGKFVRTDLEDDNFCTTINFYITYHTLISNWVPPTNMPKLAYPL